eukprot:gene8937-1859_t
MAKIQDEATVYKTIKDYMTDQNRPYNSLSIFLNLRQAISKPQIIKCLGRLVAEGVLEEKAYGKQKMYGPVQSEAEVKKEELAEIKIKTAQLEREAEQSAQQTKTIANQVRALTSKPTTEDATKQVADLKVTNQAATEKVAALTAAAGNIKPEDKARIEKEYNANVGEWKKRKRLIKNITDTILENYPKSKKALYDDIGVETDEAAGIDIGTF